MAISDKEFEQLLVTALYIVSERECAGTPTDEELEQLIHPSPRSLRRMNSIIRNPKKHIRNYGRPIYIKVLRNVAAVFVVITLLLGAAMAVSPTVRAVVIDFVRSWFEDRTEYWTPENTSSYEWSFGYVPEGFELTLMNEVESNNFRVYENDSAATIYISVSSGTKLIDNEHSTFYETEVNGRTVDVYTSNNPDYQNMIVIHDKNNGVVISIISELQISEILKIAEFME